MKLQDYIEGIAIALLFFSREFIKWWRKRNMERKAASTKNEKLDSTSALRREIQEHLIKIQIYIGCNRVSIFEYSNGTRTLNNISLQFINMTYEALDETTAAMINRFQLIAISPYLKMIKTIDTTPGYVKDKSGEGTQVDERLRRLWGTNSSYNFKIGDSIWDGCLCLTNVSSELTLTSEEIEYVQVQIMHIKELMRKLEKQ